MSSAVKSSKTNCESNNNKRCGICGDPHYYRECKRISIIAKVSDNPVLTRARLSLPDILEVKKLADDTHSIFAKCLITAGTEFGPFIAKKNLTLNPSIAFPIKLFMDNESDWSEYYLDTTDENECCWMMFVQPASEVEEHNLICYQEVDNIFFGTTRDIRPGEELRVWYSPYYAFRMQKKTLKPHKALPVQSELTRNDTEELNDLIKEQQKIIPRVIWNCKFCFKLEKNVTDFATHLLTHYISPKQRSCHFCQKKFRYALDLKKHLKLFHSDANKKDKPGDIPQVPKPEEHALKISPVQPKRTTIGGPLLFQCFTDTLDNSNSLLPHSGVNMFDLENYDNPNLLLDENLRLNIDVMGSGHIDELNVEDSEKKEYLCDICLKRFMSSKAIRDHLRLHIGKYFCSTCKKVFGRQENLKHHKCNQVYSFKCPKCDKIFYQKKYLVKHVTIYHEKKFTCSLCHKYYCSPSDLKNHICKKSGKEAKAPYQCSRCPKKFFSRQGLRNHQNRHTNNYSLTYVCYECSNTFASKDIYQRHVASVHTKTMAFDCRICDKIFSRKDILKEHLINIHMLGRNEQFPCPTCKKEFTSLSYLNKHIRRVHDDNKYTCELCSTTFKYSFNLLRHKKLLHNKEYKGELFECPVCQHKLKCKKSLQSHLRKKHPDKYKVVYSELNARRDERMKNERYKCPICNHEVKLRASLQRHIANKHPRDLKSLGHQINENKFLVDKRKKAFTSIDEELDNYLDLQKTIENMDFNLDTCHDHLNSGNEMIDKFLKESSDQISILFADSPKAIVNPNDIGSTAVRDRITNREVGLSMPDLSEMDQDVKTGKSSYSSTSTIGIQSDTNIQPPDVVLYVLNEKGNLTKDERFL